MRLADLLKVVCCPICLYVKDASAVDDDIFRTIWTGNYDEVPARYNECMIKCVGGEKNLLDIRVEFDF